MPNLQKEAIKRTEVLWFTPDQIAVKDGLNGRDLTTPDNIAHIEELAASMRANGFIGSHPLEIFTEGELIYISDGHCRFEAAKMAGVEKLPCVPEPKHVNEVDRILAQSSHNASKKLTPLEEGRNIRRAMALGGLSESEVAERIGKSVSYVSNMLVLVGSAPEIQQMVKSGEVKATVAVQTIRSEGDAATETLKEAVTIAKAEGKKKATSKQVAKATYARKDPNAQSIQDRVEALRAMPALDALEKFEKLVKPKALVFEALLKSAPAPAPGQDRLVAALRGLLAECALEPDHPAVAEAWEALKAVEGQ